MNYLYPLTDVLLTVDDIYVSLLGRNRNAFCVVRPPGHHAGYEGRRS